MTLDNSSTTPEAVELFGIVPDVPAGVHHLTIAGDGNSPNPGLLSSIGGDHTAAIALGG